MVHTFKRVLNSFSAYPASLLEAEKVHHICVSDAKHSSALQKLVSKLITKRDPAKIKDTLADLYSHLLQGEWVTLEFRPVIDLSPSN